MEKQGDSETSRKQFTKKEYQLVCEWLEEDENLEKVHGAEGKTKVGPKPKTRKQGFEALAAFINGRQLKGSKLVKLDGQAARNRFTYLVTKYKKTKPIVERTGWGLTEKDQKSGIRTLEAKKESLCPCYSRLDVIFGHKPSVKVSEHSYFSQLNSDTVDVMPWANVVPNPLAGEGDLDPQDVEDDDLENGQGITQQTDPAPASIPDPEQVIDIAQDEDEWLGEPPTVTQVPKSGGDAVVDSPVGEGGTNIEDPLPMQSKNSTKGPDQSSTQPKNNSKGIPATAKRKSTDPLTFPPKKASQERGHTLASAYASGMESISKGKAQANDIRQQGQEMHFAALEKDRALKAEMQESEFRLRAEQSKGELDLATRRLKMDVRKMNQEARMAKMQARIELFAKCSNRTPAELAELSKLMDLD